jgi:Ca2+:H+ antiporter
MGVRRHPQNHECALRKSTNPAIAGNADGRADLASQLQRSINLSLGTALSSISLAIPAVLIIGFVADKTIILGLDAPYTILLLLTLAVSMLTFALERTNLLLGAVHLLLFLAYLMLIFEK